jgi:hypothetical protein
MTNISEFKRESAPKWNNEVPGAHWFKADLHVHTIDDHAGGNARWPQGIIGDPLIPGDLMLYARAFLQGVIRAGIQVVGLTPHSPRAGTSPDTSAVWHIVDTWNKDDDDDGVPFREKIFAIYPGFEPNVADGHEGIHLLLLFDPEIGRARYLALFDAIMEGRDHRRTPQGSCSTRISLGLACAGSAFRWGARSSSVSEVTNS